MPDYSKIQIYKIQHLTDEKLIYVGSTTSFISRKSEHKRIVTNSNNKSYNQKIYKIIRDNGGWDNFNMIVIKDFPCENKQQALTEEDKIMRQLNAVMNSQRALLSKEESITKRAEYTKKYNNEHKEQLKIYRDSHKEHAKEIRGIYLDTNKEKIKDYTKKYNNEHKEQQQIYRDSHKEHIKEIWGSYREKNKEMLKEKSKNYYDNNKEKIFEYAEKHREEKKEYARKYRELNKAKLIEQRKALWESKKK